MIKKIVVFVIFSGLVLATVPFFRVDATTIWSRGNENNEVKNIQEILKTDPAIYPEGLTTGYYGSLTEKAVNKIQARCGVPQTGVVDEETERCIYPVDYKVKVISPNGGENWDRSQIQTIKWEATAPTSTAFRSYPFWNKASIDLFKKILVAPTCATGAGATCVSTTTGISVFVKHIATVNLLDLTYSWRVSNSIANGENYVVRITIGKNIIPIWAKEQAEGRKDIDIDSTTDIWPVSAIRGTNWDESDAKFQISGTLSCVNCPECPACPTKCTSVSEVVKILQNLIAEINKAIALLNQMSTQ
jgi:peptidoglycan hydrolase-like protein with peptidoglycan-binding domain